MQESKPRPTSAGSEECGSPRCGEGQQRQARPVQRFRRWRLSTCSAAGRIVFEGTPADLVAARSTLTGEHLAAFVGGEAKTVRAR
jgi:hypothetical protein